MQVELTFSLTFHYRFITVSLTFSLTFHVGITTSTSSTSSTIRMEEDDDDKEYKSGWMSKEERNLESGSLPGRCECENGWEGPYCDQKGCPSISNTKSCSGHGQVSCMLCILYLLYETLSLLL